MFLPFWPQLPQQAPRPVVFFWALVRLLPRVLPLGLDEPAVVGPYTDLSCANRLADVLIGEASALGNVV